LEGSQDFENRIMLDSTLIPSRLADPLERTGVTIVPPSAPSRLRTFHILYQFSAMLAGITWLWVRQRLDGEEAGRRVRECLERLGSLWIRTGRIVALRRDLFSIEFCQELDKIRDWEDGFPVETARRIVEEELGRPLETIFDEFGDRPFVATTSSQIHMAHLRRENTWVAVNVQRPYARQVFSHDMKLIRWMARILGSIPSLKMMRWADLCHELQTLINQELDYRFEASSVRHLKHTLAAHDVYIYSVYREYSAQRVLVTEFIRGALMADYIRIRKEDPATLQRWLATNNIHSKKLAKRLFECVLRQIFEDNFFHGDMRPGNIVLLKNSEFSVLDTRSVSSTEAETLQKYRLFLHALVNEEFEFAADTFFLLTSVLPRVDTVEVKKDIIRMWKTWTLRTHIRELPYNEKSLTYMFGELQAIVLRYRFAIQWSTMHMIRTLANMDAVIQHLAPETNSIKALKRYFLNAKKRENRAAFQNAQVTSIRLISKMREMPQRLAGYALFQDIVLRRQSQIISGSTAKVGYVLGSFFAITALLFCLAGIFLAFAFLRQMGIRIGGIPIDHLLGTQLSTAAEAIPHLHWLAWLGLLGAMFIAFRFNNKLATRFRAKDVPVQPSNVSV